MLWKSELCMINLQKKTKHLLMWRRSKRCCNELLLNTNGWNKLIWKHYYKMWVWFTITCSLDQWIHCFSTRPCLLQWIHSKSSEITWHIKRPYAVAKGFLTFNGQFQKRILKEFFQTWEAIEDGWIKVQAWRKKIIFD